MLGLAIISFALYEEALYSRDSRMNKWIRKQLGARDLHTFLAEKTLDMPYDDEVPECDYETMTAKRFFNDYVKKNRPCLFKGYGKLQKAYHLW
jgi:hypothetical protein